ncbi:MAG: protein kinase [Candidatus Melainabacteria bacterium]|nr:protein kinase [Candidatus Melainabacteria bacterium]
MVSPETFNDRYIIISLLGEGGVGKVFKVRDILLDKEFALKVLHKESNELAIARFQKEAKAAGRLKHSNICNIVDFGVDNKGHHYMVMEFLIGTSLAEMISNKPIQPEQATLILKEICLGLAFAHKNGVLHRDLKPANVQILNETEEPVQVKLLDFGMAGLIDADSKLTQTGALVGSPLYMAPELIEGEAASVQSDIYSLGCLWFEMITGHAPFRGNSILETLSMHKNEEVPKLDSSIEIAPELKNLLYKCLSKQKNNRPNNVEEIIEILGQKKESDHDIEIKTEQATNKNNKTAILALTILGTLAVFVPFILLFNHNLPESAAPNSKPIGLESDQLPDTKNIKVSPNQSVEDDQIKFLKNKGDNRLVLRDSETLTGIGFKTIKDKNIDSLDLKYTGFEDQNVIYLKNLSNLKNLEISSPKLTDESMSSFAELKTLQNLDLESDKITDKGLKELGKLTKLSKLTLRCELMTFDWLNDINLPELKELLLEKLTPTGSIKPGLTQFAKLQFLKLATPGIIDDKIIEALESTKIKYFYLEAQKISNEQMRSISKIKTLNSVLLSNSQVLPQGIQYLAALKNLDQLAMKQNQNISKELVQAIAKLNLKQLDFAGSNLSDEELPFLLENSKLEHLILKNSNTSQESERLFSIAFRSKWKRECKID